MPNKTLTVYLANNNGKDCYVWWLPQGQVWAMETDDRAEAMHKLATDFRDFFDKPAIDASIAQAVRDEYDLHCPWKICRVNGSVSELLNEPMTKATQMAIAPSRQVANGRNLVSDYPQG